MSTTIGKVIACVVMVTAVAICWHYNTASSSASGLDLSTVLTTRPDLLDDYLVATASAAKKDKDKDKDKDDDDDGGGTGEPPAGSSGTLGVKVTSFLSTNGGQTCFPFSQGWDRSYTTQFFRGPFAAQTPNPFPNTGNVASVTIDTMHSSNGTTLATGIVITKNAFPNVKVCGTNVGPIVYPLNPNLSKATFAPTETGVFYRVTILYKSSTAAGISNVYFNWAYP